MKRAIRRYAEGGEIFEHGGTQNHIDHVVARFYNLVDAVERGEDINASGYSPDDVAAIDFLDGDGRMKAALARAVQKRKTMPAQIPHAPKKRYAEGGAVDPNIGQQTSTESSLSNWAGPFVTDLLGKGAGIASMPYTAYEGPLSAGPSDIQSKLFSGIASSPMPSVNGSYTPMSFTDAGVASRYMNPYLQQVLDPQLNEARRQADITRVNQAGRLTKAGAYGGSRQAVMEAALNRDLMNKQDSITGQGYYNAFETGRGQFNTEEDRRRTGIMDQNRFGLDYMNAAADIGETQHDIEQQGVTADYDQFKEERDFPYKNVQFVQSLLQGLPLATQNYSYTEPSSLNQFLGGAGGILQLLEGWGDLVGDE